MKNQASGHGDRDLFSLVARIWPGVLRHWLFPSASGGHPPRLYPIRGLGLLPGVPNKGNADGAAGIFDNAGRAWALLCDRTHLKKTLYHIRLVVGRMINTRSFLVRGPGRVCLDTGVFPRPQRAFPHAFTPFGGVKFIAWRLRRP